MSWFRSWRQDAKQETSPPESIKEPKGVKESSAQAQKEGGLGPSAHVGGDQGVSHGSEEVLITISSAIVHRLVGNESTHLATGPFSLVRLAQKADGTAVIAKVGADLQWPLVEDAPISKLDDTHYLFTISVPPAVDDEADKSSLLGDGETSVLNYGVTFLDDGWQTTHMLLDKLLAQYSLLSLPEIAQGDPEKKAELDKEVKDKGRVDQHEGKPNPPAKPRAIPKEAETTTVPASITDPAEKRRYIEKKNADYWKTFAPNVDDYRGSMAKGIARHSNKLIRGLFWCSDGIIWQLERLGDFAKAHISKNERPMPISPYVLQSVRGIKSSSKMMDRMAKWMLAGIIAVTGLASGTVLRSRAGRQFFKMLPGQVALVSMDVFTRVFDAVEIAGKSVLISTRVVTCGVVTHRYGDKAGEVVHEGLSIVGHTLSAAWTISKIPKALYPTRGGVKVTKTGIVKSIIKGQ